MTCARLHQYKRWLHTHTSWQLYICSLHASFSAFWGSPLQALVTSDDTAESLPALLADADGVYGTLTPELLAAVCETPGRPFRSKSVEIVPAQAAV